MLKTVTLILITIYGSATNKPPEFTTETFYGETFVDAALACKAYGETRVKINKHEYPRVFVRGFTCQYNRGN